jgi:hypothetical protein
MKIQFLERSGTKISVVESEEIVINDTQDAIDLMADCRYQGSEAIVLAEEHFSPAFFDLKTRIAGEILQKFTNYQVRLAIVGDFSKYTSKSLRDFISESNKHGQILFTENQEDAFIKLSKHS